MGDKLAEYTGLVGRLHLAKEAIKEKWSSAKEEGGIDQTVRAKADQVKESVIKTINRGEDEYDHLYRRKTRWELTCISAAVMGIEFSYAAETAFVTPTLLKIGVPHKHLTLIWCLSPIVGFFLTPILGSLSDRCGSNLGRRRPFIILLSIGVILGLVLVPNGKWLGLKLGDTYPSEDDEWTHKHRVGRLVTQYNTTQVLTDSVLSIIKQKPLVDEDEYGRAAYHPWGIFFTVLGTVLLDFDADACQSPSRAYLLDVTLPDDHAVGLSTFTIMAGLGGSLGYAMGAIDWGALGVFFGGHVRLVFSLVLVIFIICVFVTLTSFSEIPLEMLANSSKLNKERRRSSRYRKFEPDEGGDEMETGERRQLKEYGSFEASDVVPEAGKEENETKHVKGNPFVKKQASFPNGRQASQDNQEKYLQVAETSFSQASPMPVEEGELTAKASMTSFTHYLWTIIYMPNSLRVLCLTNLFCWMSLVCYSLYFTDFVGEAVFKGDPFAPHGSKEHTVYDEGIRFGCWGMAMYSLSCSCYSLFIERLVKRFRAKPVYVGGQLVYCVGMIFMALTKSKWGVLVFSWSAGVMYSTLFTMPYLLVAHYHETDTYSEGDKKRQKRDQEEGQVRGIGTDVGIVSSMVFLAQFILSLSIGYVIELVGSPTAVVVAASILSFCGAISACFVTYLDL